jgi:hypothetical protein
MSDDAIIPGYVWCGHGSAKTGQVIILTARKGKRLRLRRLTGPMAGKEIMVSREQLCAALRPLAMQCAGSMIGSGGDTYDPVCELPARHEGPCRSSSAIDQHRIGPPEPHP